jgi:hypothetical protein
LTLPFPKYLNDVALREIAVEVWKVVYQANFSFRTGISIKCENLNWNTSMYCLIPMLTVTNFAFPFFNDTIWFYYRLRNVHGWRSTETLALGLITKPQEIIDIWQGKMTSTTSIHV